MTNSGNQDKKKNYFAQLLLVNETLTWHMIYNELERKRMTLIIITPNCVRLSEKPSLPTKISIIQFGSVKILTRIF